MTVSRRESHVKTIRQNNGNTKTAMLFLAKSVEKHRFFAATSTGTADETVPSFYLTKTMSRVMEARSLAPHMVMVSVNSAPIFSM